MTSEALIANSAIRSNDPENPTIELNMKWVGWPVADIWPCEISHITTRAFGSPILWEAEVVGGQRSYVEKSDGHFLYALHCDQCAVSNHSDEICRRMSATHIQQGGHFLLGGVKILGCSLWSRSVMLGSTESEHPRVTNLKISNLCEHDTSTSRTDGRTDGRTTCRSNTAVCVASRGKNLRLEVSVKLQISVFTGLQVCCM